MTSKETSLLSRKEKLEEDLRAVQKQIYELEEAYLSKSIRDTSAGGLRPRRGDAPCAQPRS